MHFQIGNTVKFQECESKRCEMSVIWKLWKHRERPGCSFLTNRGRQRKPRKTRKIFFHKPHICFKRIFTLGNIPFMFPFSLKFCWLQCLLNEMMDVCSWNVGHVLKTAWKWSSWSLIWEQDGTNVSFISHIHVRFLSCVISFIVLPTLLSPSSAASGPYCL